MDKLTSKENAEEFNTEIKRLAAKHKPSPYYRIFRDLILYGRVAMTTESGIPIADIVIVDPPWGFKMVNPGEVVKPKRSKWSQP